MTNKKCCEKCDSGIYNRNLEFCGCKCHQPKPQEVAEKKEITDFVASLGIKSQFCTPKCEHNWSEGINEKTGFEICLKCGESKKQEVAEKKGIMNTNCPYGNPECPKCNLKAEKTFKESIEAGEIECACVGNGKCGKHYFEKEEVAESTYDRIKKGSDELAENANRIENDKLLEFYDGKEEVAEWEKEFHDKYDMIDEPDDVIEGLKSFITKTIAQEKEKWKEELIEWCDINAYKLNIEDNEYVVDLLEVINKIKKQ